MQASTEVQSLSIINNNDERMQLDNGNSSEAHPKAAAAAGYSSSLASTSSSMHQQSNESRKRSSSYGNTSTNNDTNSSLTDKRIATKICRVCGDKAYSYNFNVITCESCKAFFRRNANKHKVGMKKEWIMSEEARMEKKQRVQENRERRLTETKNPNPPHRRVTKHSDDEEIPPSKVPSLTASQQSSKQEITLVTANDSHSNEPLQNNTLPSLSGIAMPTSISTSVSFRDMPTPGSIDSLPSPMITTAGFRPPLITDSTSCLFFTAAQLAAVHHVQQQQHSNKTQSPTTDYPPCSMLLSSTVIPPSLPTIPPVCIASNTNHLNISPLNVTSQLTPLNIITQNVIPPAMPQPLHMFSQSDQSLTRSLPTNDDMITVPKEVLIRLLQYNNQCNINCTSLQSPHMGSSSQTCLCTCFCGKYPPGKIIVEEVRKELSAGPSCSQTQSIEARNESLKANASRVDDWAECSNAHNANRKTETHSSRRSSLFKSASLLEEEMNSVHVVDVSVHVLVDPDCCLMTSTDQDRLNEVLCANGAWAEIEPNSVDAMRHEEGCPSKVDMINMADGAIRRMIKMVKRMDTFRRIEHHDQMQLLKYSCMEYIILRGAMSYDPEQNAWKGPTMHSGFNVKMDAMKDTRDNMFESSIRFYATFKEEWRTNEAVMLLLGMIVIFNPHFPNLHSAQIIEREYEAYKKVLKRLLFTLCGQDVKRTNVEFKGLLDKITYLETLNKRAQRMLHEIDCSQMEPLLIELFNE
ncbi:unnamed protein product [Anisakis simplex]|uniref:Nuclear hormone receptor family member nhr-48 (inferred by orthology to a C. elegans protein) n=1 Tax=Anisakis simplex TaxID=6269 RepID=A0A158PP13_ANISI|nr:unnamed protein product [Anisakis simplex]